MKTKKNYKSKNKNYKSKNKNYKSKNKNYKSKNKNYKKKKMKGSGKTNTGKEITKTSGTSGTSKKYTITNKTLEAIVKKTSNSGPLNIFQDYGMNTNNSNTSLITVGSESRVSRVSRPREFKGLTLVFTPEPFPKKTCHNISITKDKQMSCHKVFSTEEDGTNYITSDKLSGGAFGEVYTLSSHPGYILKYITQSMDKNPQEEVNYQKAAAEVGIAPQVYTLMIHEPGTDLVPASIIMEEMDYTMKEHIIKQKKLTVEKFKELIRTVLDLTGKLQNIPIYHLDIRLDNVMFSITQNKWFIIDYGIVSSDGRDIPEVYLKINTSFRSLFPGQKIPEDYEKILDELLGQYLL
mgnify:CR=1 FL=1